MKVKSIQVRYAKKSPQTKKFDHIFDDGKSGVPLDERTGYVWI